jgi:RecT family.
MSEAQPPETRENESGGVASLPAIIDLAKTYNLSAKAFAYTFRAVAMPEKHTDAEFVSCCLVAREHGLNPLTKEIYFMRDRHGRIQAIVGVDGWIKKCNEHPQFDGIEFDDHADGKGKVESIKAKIFRKDRSRPIEVTEYLSECLQSREKAGPWQSHPNRMLRHRALMQCARVAFGFAGVMAPDEFEQWQNNGGMRDITPREAPLEIPDIPELRENPGTLPIPEESPVVEPDPPLADETGILAKLREDRALCTCVDDVDEVVEQYADLIPRLSPEGQLEAAQILVVE